MATFYSMLAMLFTKLVTLGLEMSISLCSDVKNSMQIMSLQNACIKFATYMHMY